MPRKVLSSRCCCLTKGFFKKWSRGCCERRTDDATLCKQGTLPNCKPCVCGYARTQAIPRHAQHHASTMMAFRRLPRTDACLCTNSFGLDCCVVRLSSTQTSNGCWHPSACKHRQTGTLAGQYCCCAPCLPRESLRCLLASPPFPQSGFPCESLLWRWVFSKSCPLCCCRACK